LSVPIPTSAVPSSSKPAHRITLGEIPQAFHPLSDQYPPVLSLAEAASIARITPDTLKRKVSEGAFLSSARRGNRSFLGPNRNL